MPLAQKLEALRKIQLVLGRREQLSARGCGLTEEELSVLDNEGLIEVVNRSDDGPELDRYYIENISPKGFSLLAHADVAEADPLRVAVEPRQESTWSRIRRVLGGL